MIKLVIKCSSCGKVGEMYNIIDVDYFKLQGWQFDKQDSNVHLCQSCSKKTITPKIITLSTLDTRDRLDTNCRFIRKKGEHHAKKKS